MEAPKETKETIGQGDPVDEELQILKEACRALAHLDADRLEELAATCRTLNRDIVPDSLPERLSVEREDYGKQLEVLGRFVEKTHDNLTVIRRVHARSRGTNVPDVFTQAGL